MFQLYLLPLFLFTVFVPSKHIITELNLSNGMPFFTFLCLSPFISDIKPCILHSYYGAKVICNHVLKLRTPRLMQMLLLE